MMLRWSRYAMLLLLILAGALYLPRLYWRAFWNKPEQRLVRYSATLGQFVYRSSGAQNTKATYWDEDGNEYDEIEFKMQLPFVYFAFLEKYDIFPEEIEGVEFDPRRVRDEIQYVRLDPDELDAPQIQLWPLFESKPFGTQLEMPPDLFRITHRMEFVEGRSNSVDEEKSVRFTQALTDEGFTFPAQRIAGNPSTRKAFDEGYFVVDAAGTLFHIKMTDGEPVVRNTGFAPESGIRHLLIKENGRKEFYGVLITGDDRIGVISYDGYRFIPLPTPGYDPSTMPIYLWVDPLNRTVVYVGEKDVHCIAADTEYNLVRTWSYELDPATNATARKFRDLLFPFSVDTTRPESGRYVLQPDVHPGYGWLGAVVGAILLFGVRALRGAKLRDGWGDLIWTGLFGIYGALACLIVGVCPRYRPPSRASTSSGANGDGGR